MPSSIPPKITTIKDSAGNNIPKNGIVAGGSTDLTGTGFPGVTLTISVMTNGVVQVPTTPTVLIDSGGKWTTTLIGLPAGTTVVTFTESVNDPAVTPPPGATSWNFKVVPGIKEHFGDLIGQTFEMHWRHITNNNIHIYYNSANTGSIRAAREFWTPTSAQFKGKLDGNVLCVDYHPTAVSHADSLITFTLAKSKDDNTAIPFSKVSFYYLSQFPCTVTTKDLNNRSLEEKTLSVSPAIPLPASFSSPNSFSITVCIPASQKTYSPSWSFIVGNLEITP